MPALVLLGIAAFVLCFALVSRRIEDTPLTPPMVFVAFGLLISPHTFQVDAGGFPHAWIELVAEWTLVLVLFTDAARINLRSLRENYRLPLRLLGIGLPLCILLGALAAAVMFPAISFWEAALLAAILAPTDAALGIAVVTNPLIPIRIRQALNVESGLNDGICLPFVLFFAAGASVQGQTESIAYWLQFAFFQLLLGPVTGVAAGYLGGRCLRRAVAMQWITDPFLRIAALALAALAYLGAEAVGGNGFIAAFCAGLALGNTARAHCKTLYEFAETEGQLLALVAFLLFGVQFAWPALAGDHALAVLIYAFLSLTVLRMVPVVLALAGTGLRPPTTLFLGWFGPRGMASIVYALLMIKSLKADEHHFVFQVVMCTVLVSVFAHGMTAVPLARRYGAWCARDAAPEATEEHQAVPAHPVRIRAYRGGRFPSP